MNCVRDVTDEYMHENLNKLANNVRESFLYSSSTARLYNMQMFQTCFSKVRSWENDTAFVESMRQGQMYEESIFEEHLAPIVANASVMLDIGAHIGSQSLMSAHENPDLQIIAFEAQEKMFRLLCKNLDENSIRNIDARNVAVGHVCHPSVGIANFVEDHGVVSPDVVYGGNVPFNLGGIGLCGPNASEATSVVPMVTIDSLQLPHVDYMKIDVEGFEPLMLLGAQETINRCKPVILYEHNEKQPIQSALDHFGLQRNALPESEEILKSLGYNSITALPHDNWIAKVT